MQDDETQPRLHIFIIDELTNMYRYNGSNFREMLEKDEMNIFVNKNDAVFNVVLLTGPVGGGKTTYGRMLAEKYANAEYIDGDEFFGLDQSMVLGLGQERNSLTQYAMYNALMHGKTVILSTGCGALKTSFKGGIEHNAFGELDNIYDGFQLNVTVIVPSITDHIVVGNNLIKRLVTPLYEDETLEKVVRQRKYNNPNIFAILKKVNKSNSRIQFDMIDWLKDEGYLRKVIHVPFINEGNHDIVISHHDEIAKSIIDVIDQRNNTHNVVMSKFKFIQHRLLIHSTDSKMPYMKGNEYCFHHITWNFDRKLISYVDNHIPHGIMCCARHVKLASSNSRCELLLVDLPELFPKELRIKAHVTIVKGNHAASEMSNIAVAIRKREKTVTVPNERGENVTYDIEHIINSVPSENELTQIVIDGEFYTNY